MKTFYILHENHQWMPSIRDALNRQQVQFEEWYLADGGLIDLTTPPPNGIFLNRVSPSAHTRNHQHSSSYALAVLNWLETYQRVVLNGSNIMNMEISKIAQFNALSAADIATPKTMAAFSKDDLLIAAKKLGFPLLTKHNCGGRGAGVRKFDHLEGLQDYLKGNEYEEPVDGINLVQEYISSPEKCIIRLEFINKKFVYAVRISTADSFNLCPADSCSIEGSFCATSAPEEKFKILQNFAHPLIPQCESFLKFHNMDVAGIEFITDANGKSYVYDINANTNYNTKAETQAGISAHDTLAKFIAKLQQSEE